MSKITVLFNQDYAEHPDDFPGKKDLLEKVQKHISKADSEPVMRGIRFEPGPTGNIHDHVASQVQSLLPDIMSGKIVTCFGDSGNGVVLGAFDQVGRHHEQQTGTELSDLVRNPIYLAPGGTYNHGPIAMGTNNLSEISDFAGKEKSGYKDQLVRIRNTRVIKNQIDEPETATEVTEHPFFAFAGMFFDAYILHKNEKLGRKEGSLKNSLRVIKEAMQEVFGNNAEEVMATLRQAFGGEILVGSNNESQVHRRSIPQSKLRAITTLPSWGYARFDKSVESLDREKMYLMESDQAGPVDMLKITAAANIIGASRQLLRFCLQQIHAQVESGRHPQPGDMKDILRKFAPKEISAFKEKFDPALLGGLNYSTDGYPHKVSVKPNEEAHLEISTIPNSKVHIVRKSV